LNRLVQREPALHEVDFRSEGFEWLDCMNNNDSVISYVRKAEDPDDYLIVACNFTPIVRHGYRLGVPKAGFYTEVFNSDSSFYAGSNVGNFPGCQADWHGHHGRPASLFINLPPLATVVLKPQR
jgi:1,4-alpha-glucan branching enzyme